MTTTRHFKVVDADGKVVRSWRTTESNARRWVLERSAAEYGARLVDSTGKVIINAKDLHAMRRADVDAREDAARAALDAIRDARQRMDDRRREQDADRSVIADAIVSLQSLGRSLQDIADELQLSKTAVAKMRRHAD